MSFNEIFEKLLDTYSYQGWWPITDYDGTNPTKTGSTQGYHPGDYSFPRNSLEQFEIIIGAVLTQNTSWPQVEKSIINLKELTDLTPHDILDLDENDFKNAIKPSGYFNQKYNYLINVSKFYISLDGEAPERKDLLSVKGIGPETADSILLYAYGKKEFVVDAYTRRIFSYLGLINEKDTYNKIKKLFEDNFDGDINDYQEYHALIVEHAKNYYFKKPYGVDDIILNNFKVK
jgi:endonuclease-3 related protein